MKLKIFYKAVHDALDRNYAKVQSLSTLLPKPPLDRVRLITFLTSFTSGEKKDVVNPSCCSIKLTAMVTKLAVWMVLVCVCVCGVNSR